MDTDMNLSESTGYHESKIMGYSLNKGLGIHNYIESAKFDAAGCEWTIKFYPDGRLADNSHVCVLISLASVEKEKIVASYELTVVDQSGMNQHKVFPRSNLCSFKYPGSMSGIPIRTSALEPSKYIKDDCILIRSSVWVFRLIREEPKIYSVVVPPSNIVEQFGQLLESGEGSDVRFKVGGEIFAAHKIVLAARSPVFKAQLIGPMKDDETKESIEIVDMEASVFKALLHFMYSDVVPDFDSLFFQHLLEAADRYGLERLRLICESKLSEGISIDNGAATLALAEQHHCFQLKTVCFQFIAQKQNLKAMMQTDGFKQLVDTCPSILLELLHYAVVGLE